MPGRRSHTHVSASLPWFGVAEAFDADAGLTPLERLRRAFAPELSASLAASVSRTSARNSGQSKSASSALSSDAGAGAGASVCFSTD